MGLWKMVIQMGWRAQLAGEMIWILDPICYVNIISFP